MEQRITFEEIIEYAEIMGFAHREGPSRAKNYSHLYFYNHWVHESIMVLYEGERRTLRGHDKPEVCWICVNYRGQVMSVPSRHLRLMDSMCGFGLSDQGFAAIKQTLNNNKYIQQEA